MKAYFITGIAGTGKSAIATELRELGYHAVDGDEHLAKWRERKTGAMVSGDERQTGPHGSKNELYEWLLSEKKIEYLEDHEKSDVLFVCGTSSNHRDLFYLFDKVFCLTITEGEMVRRLGSRSSNAYGKNPADLAQLKQWREPSQRDDIEAGAIPIDATQPLGVVIQTILEKVEN